MVSIHRQFPHKYVFIIFVREQIHFKIVKISNEIIYNVQLISFNFKMNCAHTGNVIDRFPV